MRSLLQTNANIDMASTVLGEGLWVYAGWDNPVRKQISLARSLNGGSTWEDPIMIDGPEIGSPNVIPYNLRVAASGEKALLVWLKGQPGAYCTMHYKWSGDGGNSWSERFDMLESVQGCPSDLDFISLGSDLFVLQVTVTGSVYLLAWDGSTWSEPQLQKSINEFEDPETYNLLDFSCHQYGTDPQKKILYLVGCNLTGVKDIWLTAREMGDTDAWFPLPGLWSDPITLASGTGEIKNPILVASPDTLLLAFWTGTGEGPISTGISSIYNARRFGGIWSQPSIVLNSLEGNARELDVTWDQSGRIFSVWSGGDSGEVQISRAGVNQAYRSSDWTSPDLLPSLVPAGSSPDIYSAGLNRLLVVYAVPLNEARGIYLVSSDDAGNNWSESKQVFNAVEYGWDSVSHPKITVSEDGTLHVLFTRFTLPGGSGPLSLHYIRSTDGGITWSQPEVVAEQHLYWSRLVLGNDSLIHRLWQGMDTGSNRLMVYHQYSLDAGNTWSSTEVISPLQLNSVDLDVDSVGRLHLVMSVTHSPGEISLEHWIWSGDRWTVDQGLKLEEMSIFTVDSLSTSVTPAGYLGVLYSGTLLPEFQYTSQDLGSTSVGKNFVAYTGRDLDILTAIMAPIPESSPSPIQTAEPVILVTPEINPSTYVTVPLEGELPKPMDTSTKNSWTGVILGAGLAVVLVAVAFGINAKKMGRR
jgi:hypothetical protein